MMHAHFLFESLLFFLVCMCGEGGLSSDIVIKGSKQAEWSLKNYNKSILTSEITKLLG